MRGITPQILDGTGKIHGILILRFTPADSTAFSAAFKDAVMMLLVEFPETDVFDAFIIELKVIVLL